MRIACIGGGPAGLYFAILMKKLDPGHRIDVFERNPRGHTFGFGVVFSDETLGFLAEHDAESHRRIVESFARWSDIEIGYRDTWIRSRGHGFSGLSRRRLLEILEQRAEALGVRLHFEREIGSPGELGDYDLIVAADGVRSRMREELRDLFRPEVEVGRCRYIWLGTARRFDAFTFLFEPTEHGWFQVHAYPFEAGMGTFIVECHEDTWKAAGLDRLGVEQGVAYLERLFARHLNGHGLVGNRSSWVNFLRVTNQVWWHGKLVLVGDAAHTAHFSVGSGTKLAMEDAIALSRAFSRHPDVKTALPAYESERRPQVARIQEAARASRHWFENVHRYMHFEPTQLGFSLLTRSRRIGYENLGLRDPDYAAEAARWFVRRSSADPDLDRDRERPTPPMFTPLRLRDLVLGNRVVVSPMCMYSARDGCIDDFHLVHLGSRALGGAGLVMTEATAVSPEGRISPGCAGLYTPEHRDLWRRVVEFVHARSAARIGIQLAHAGRKGSTPVPWADPAEPQPGGGWPLLGPSPLPFDPRSQVPRAMDRADMDRVRDQFVRAARWAEEAGFDLLELHMAHGYLLSSFLTPLGNRRDDAYGGSLEKRLRFPLEVFEAVRAAWPAHRPMSVRISATDWVEGGLTGDDAVAIARVLKERGLDIVDVSAGGTSPEARPVYGRAFQTPLSDQVRNEARIATIAVGNITTPDEVNSILLAGRADLCALARPHLADPFWTLHAAAALEHDEQPWPVPYRAARPRPSRPR